MRKGVRAGAKDKMSDISDPVNFTKQGFRTHRAPGDWWRPYFAKN